MNPFAIILTVGGAVILVPILREFWRGGGSGERALVGLCAVAGPIFAYQAIFS